MVAELRLAHQFHVADVQLRPEVPACRIAEAQVLRSYSAARSVLNRPARDLAPRLVVALAADHVVAVSTVYPRKLTAVSLSLLRPGRVREIARLVELGLRRVRTARAKDLRAAQMAGLSRRDELVRLVVHLQRAKAICVLRPPRASPLLPVVAVRRVCPFHAQRLMANRLTRVPVLHRERRDRLCRAVQAYPPDRDPHLLGSSLRLAPDCPARARQHELAAEHSSDFRL